MLSSVVSDNGPAPTGNKPLPEPMLNRVILSGTNDFTFEINTNSEVKEDNMYFIYVQGNNIGNDIAITCLNLPEPGRYCSSAGSSGLVQTWFWYYGMFVWIHHAGFTHRPYTYREQWCQCSHRVYRHPYIHILTYKHPYAGMEMANFDEIYRGWRHQDGTWRDCIHP